MVGGQVEVVHLVAIQAVSGEVGVSLGTEVEDMLAVFQQGSLPLSLENLLQQESDCHCCRSFSTWQLRPSA